VEIAKISPNVAKKSKSIVICQKLPNVVKIANCGLPNCGLSLKNKSGEYFVEKNTVRY
jgi:hypothetical protein